MRSGKIEILVCLSLTLFTFGCGLRSGAPPGAVETEQAPPEAASESGQEIAPQMIAEYAMVHQMSDLKTAEFYLTHPDYAKKHPYKPTQEDVAFYEGKFLKLMFLDFKKLEEKVGSRRAMTRLKEGVVTTGWESEHRVSKSLKRSKLIDDKLTEATRLYKEDRIDDAIESMETAVQADPNSPTLLYNLGLMHMKDESYQEAVEYFQRSLESIKATGHTKLNLIMHPKVYLGACVNLGLVYTHIGMYDEAIKILEEAIRFRPDDLDANWNLANVYWSMGDIEKAAQQMQRYIKLDPDNAEAHNIVGLNCYCEKLYDAALDEFRTAAKLNADEKQYSYNEALTLIRLERYDEAQEALDRASGMKEGEYLRQVYAELIPANNAKKLYNDGCAAMRGFDSARAIDLFKAALELKPDMVSAHVNLGVLYGMKGDRGSQIHHFEEAVRLEPDLANMRYNLGLAYSDAWMYSEAITELRRAVELDPSLRDAHFKLGILLCKARDFTNATTEFEECLELSPNWPEAHLNLGTCYLKTGNVNGAIEQFKQLVQLNPKSAESHYSLGIAYMKAQKLDEASPLFQKALEIDPAHRQAQTMLKEIETYQGK